MTSRLVFPNRSKRMQKQVIIDAFLLLLFVICCVKNAVNLNIALHFYHDIKDKAYTHCYAVITMAYGISNRNYDSRKYAKAKYNIDGKDITGKMVCSYDSRVEKGDKVYIIVPQNNLNIFAFSEKQVKNAVMTYSVLTSFFALCFITIAIACAYLYMK